MLDWIKDNDLLIMSISGVSAIIFVATLIAIPMLIVRLPTDYFVRDDVRLWDGLRREVRIAVFGAKNLLGGVLLAAGLSMLVLPGQGVLTILVAIMLLDFPGKRRLERWLIRRHAIHRMLNWIRARRHRPPLELPRR